MIFDVEEKERKGCHFPNTPDSLMLLIQMDLMEAKKEAREMISRGKILTYLYSKTNQHIEDLKLEPFQRSMRSSVVAKFPQKEGKRQTPLLRCIRPRLSKNGPTGLRQNL
ncbi:hypothetical protein YC2023_070675 [Brassica napus]